MLGSLAIADILTDLTYFALNAVVYSVKLLNHTAVWVWKLKILRARLSIPLLHILDTRLSRSIDSYIQRGIVSAKRDLTHVFFQDFNFF